MSRDGKKDRIGIEDDYYILATSSRVDERTRVLKDGDTFGVFDEAGDIRPVGVGEQGIYYSGTRYLSRAELRLGTLRPLLLSSSVKEANDLLAVDLTNPDISVDQDLVVPRGVLHMFRSKFLYQAACFERIRVWNYGAQALVLSLVLTFDADYCDMFEVRGRRRDRRGRRLADAVENGALVLGYEGLDGVTRRTRITAAPQPHEIAGAVLRFELPLPPREAATLTVTATCEEGVPARVTLPYDRAYQSAAIETSIRRAAAPTVTSSNGSFDEWLARSRADLHMMLTETPHGFYPYAGMPWSSTIFGRDGILTALQVLAFEPMVSHGVLAYLAATQATAWNPAQEGEPGKILHEVRSGEMATLGEVPFGHYYGSVDATPLFVVLAEAYFARTADRAFATAMWPHVAAALEWMDGADRDGDGFIEYSRDHAPGPAHQGWRESVDAVFHADGRLAEGPIALVEVQAYVYAARMAAANLARALGDGARADALEAQARALREAFERQFWCDELGTYALALDGAKEPCRVRSSNAGHCLFAGIADPGRARRVGETLLAPESFSGWGIRTIASSEARYNPMSYHNGSVWPHDNALIAAGLRRYGFTDLLMPVMTGLFEASRFVDVHRLPQLFCGFHRRPAEGPTLYPVACAPQASASGAAYMLLQACLGLQADAANRRFVFHRPVVPPWLREVCLAGLRLHGDSLDLVVGRVRGEVSVNVTRQQGEVGVITTP